MGVPADGMGVPADGMGVPADGMGVPADGMGVPADGVAVTGVPADGMTVGRPAGGVAGISAMRERRTRREALSMAGGSRTEERAGESENGGAGKEQDVAWGEKGRGTQRLYT